MEQEISYPIVDGVRKKRIVSGHTTIEFAVADLILRAEADKASVKADGQDTAIIRAKLYDYKDEPAEANNLELRFVCGDMEIPLKMSGGSISIPFTTMEVGTYQIRIMSKEVPCLDIVTVEGVK